jgi:hypothetical protein
MKFEKGKELNRALISIIKIGDGILAHEEDFEFDAHQQELVNIERLNQLHEDYIDELKENIESYKNNDYVFEYLHICFDNFLNWKGFSPETADAITVRNQYNVWLLLKLKKTLERYQIMISKWFTLNQNFTQPGKHMLISFREVLAEIYKMKYMDDTKLLQNAEDLKEIQRHSVADPEIDTDFDFKKLKTACDNQPTVLAKIGLINQRLSEFRNWKLGDIDNDTVTRIQAKRELIDLYSPNFEKQCQNEIDSLRLKLRPENKPVTITSTTLDDDNAHTLYQWNASDTDLLELSTALLKIQAITRKDGKKMTHKEMNNAFEKLFDYQIKDAKGKLATAVNRKKSVTPFLDRLVVAFKAYSRERDEK